MRDISFLQNINIFLALKKNYSSIKECSVSMFFLLIIESSDVEYNIEVSLESAE